MSGMFISMLVCMLCIGARSARGEDAPFPVFGSGKTEVRLYTDYFCVPCRQAAVDLGKMLAPLVKKNRIRLKLIDLPFHQGSILYTKYFLYALNAKGDYDSAMAARNALYESAAEAARVGKLPAAGGLSAMFSKKGIPFREYNPRASFDMYTALLKEDRARITPSVVIISGGKRKAAEGREEVVAAIRQLR